jgi:peptidoglycan/LPS O-acetylase OafA/YrhL
MPFIPALEGLRGAAFILVFTAHASQFVNAPRQLSGKEGLFLFFVLTSYLLTKGLAAAFATHTHKLLVLLNYAIRRILRIYPMYALSMVFVPAVILDRHPLTTIIKHLFLTEGREHLWAIPVEMRYYVLLPSVALLFAALTNKGIRVLIGAVCIFLAGYGLVYEKIASSVAVHHLGNELSIWLYLPAFIIGSCASFFPIPGKNSVLLKYGNGLALILVLLLCATLSSSYYVFVEKNAYTAAYYFLMVLYSLIWAAVILLTAAHPAIFRSFFENRILRAIGKVSFSAYLWHYSLFIWTDVTFKYGVALAAPLKILLIFAVTLILSAITYRLIEKPFLNIRLLTENGKS